MIRVIEEGSSARYPVPYGNQLHSPPQRVIA